MPQLINITKESIVPTSKDVMKHQGIPEGTIIKNHIVDLFNTAKDLFLKETTPLCVLKELSKEDFKIIYNGEGNNEDESPIKQIYQDADNLALFAFTLGMNISRRISDLFDKKDFAQASMLDSFASAAVDIAVEHLEKYFYDKLKDKNLTQSRSLVFSYSPGYCGWNIDAQKKLFEFLHPEKIGITLNDSCLMTPIKSVSGVLIHGDKTIHDFRNNFGFCANCKTESCLERIDKIYKH